MVKELSTQLTAL